MPYGNFIHLRAHNLQNSRIPIRIRIRTFTPLGWGAKKLWPEWGWHIQDPRPKGA